jgi:hypothetical protein
MRKIALCSISIAILLLLSACLYRPTPRCTSGRYQRPGNTKTGEEPTYVLAATFCRDKSDYKRGDVVHFTLTVENTWDRPIELDRGEKSVLDICVDYDSCWSDHHPSSEWPTQVVLEPDGSFTLEWDWPVTQAEREAEWPKGVSTSNRVYAWGYWLTLRGRVGELSLGFSYGEYSPP